MRTNADYTTTFKDYGEITVPKGTRVTHQTTVGVDEKYHFIDEFGWVERDYPEISRVLKHDLMYYGLNVPKKFISKNKKFSYELSSNK